MSKAFLFAAGFALLAGPAMAQYGGGGQNSGGPLGSYLRNQGHGYGGYYGGYGYYAPPPVYYGGPAYYGGYYPYDGGGGALAAEVIGGLALGALGRVRPTTRAASTTGGSIAAGDASAGRGPALAGWEKFHVKPAGLHSTMMHSLPREARSKNAAKMPQKWQPGVETAL
jgi:hypothetical protein